MALSPRTASIAVALLLSGSFIALGYYLSSPLSPRFADASSTEELLKEYAEKDTDEDGLPDWQESLYGTDPANPSSTGSGLTDAEAVKSGAVKPRFASETLPSPEPVSADDFDTPAPAAGSLTEEFSRTFMQRYLERGGGHPLEDAEEQQIVSTLIAEYAQKSSERFASGYGTLSVRADAGVTAVSYAGALEAVLTENPAPTPDGDSVSLLTAYIERNDSSARAKLAAYAATYAGIAKGFSGVAAPPALEGAHLELVRSFDMLAKATRVIAEEYETDPVSVFGAIEAYLAAWGRMEPALIAVGKAILASGEPAAGTPGAHILEMARSVDKP